MITLNTQVSICTNSLFRYRISSNWWYTLSLRGSRGWLIIESYVSVHFFTDGLHNPYFGFRFCLPPRGFAHLHRAAKVSPCKPVVFTTGLCRMWLSFFFTTPKFLISVHQRRRCKRFPIFPSLLCTPCTFWLLCLAT